MHYKFQALKDNKIIIDGEIDAVDLRDAREKIRQKGLLPTKITEIKPNENYIINHLSLSQKISFTTHLETLASAGISILESLDNIKLSSPDSKIRFLCTEVKEVIVNQQKTLSEALNIVAGNAFGNVYITLIKAGENSGKLEQTLRRIIKLLKNQDNIRGNVIRASIYPSFLIILVLGLLILFSTFVFPKFVEILTINGSELPLFAQTVFDTINFIGKFWWLIIISTAAFIGIISFILKNEDFKNKFDDFILQIPLVRDFVQYINLSNFISILHTSYESGVPIISGMELTLNGINNYIIKKSVIQSINIAKEGKTLTESLQYTIPGEFLSMISAGEKSGSLGKMFDNISNIIDKRINMIVESMMKLIEPSLLIIIGLLVLIIAVAFMQAYAGMLSSFF